MERNRGAFRNSRSQRQSRRPDDLLIRTHQEPMKSLSILVLAAGAGTRMKSALPKVLHPMLGKPLLEHVLAAASALKPKAVGVILGVGREQVRATLEKNGHDRLTYIVQDKPKGSGHAVIKALPWLRKQKGSLLVV